MAKIYGSNRVIGTVGKVRHYILPGVEGIVAAECGGATAEQIKNNPAFARTRENMEEWKGAVLMGKKVWERLGISARPIVYRFLIGKLNKAMLKVLRSDQVGLRGVRSIILSEHKNMLDNIQYWYYKPFRDVMKCRFEVDTGPDRRSVTARLINLNPIDQINPPAEATHFRFFLSIGVVCDHRHCQKVLDGYEPVYDNNRMQFGANEVESEWFPIDAKAIGDKTFTATLPDNFGLADDMTVLRIFGIVYGKMTSEVEPLKKDRGSCEFLGAV
jgi:hypothetical protein